MMDKPFQDDEPCYVISVVARLVELHPQTLRYYDKIGLLRPSRTRGRTRLYSLRDVEELRKITRLIEDLGVNLAGVEVIMNMSSRIAELQRELVALQEESAREIEQLRLRLQEYEDGELHRKEGYGIIEVTPVEKDPE
jgi:MerR family transcriptional regulator, heat shock protein HspR